MRRTTQALTVGAVATLAFAATATSAHAANLGKSISRGSYIHKGDYLSRSMTAGYKVQLIMQQDGNLVLKATDRTSVCWNSGTAGRGHQAVYQQDGNFVVVNASGRVLWASNTVGATWDTGATVNVGTHGALYAGYKKVSKDCPPE